MTIPKILQSSDGNGQLSDTVRGVLILIMPGLMVLAQRYNIALTETDVYSLVLALSTIFGAGWTVYGIIKKAANWYTNAK